MVASYFKKNKIKGKVVLLDPGDKPFAPKAPGFLAAFKDLYKDVLEYHPSTNIKSVDPEKKTVTTEFDTVKFDDAAIYPRVRAAKLIEDLGLHDRRARREGRHRRLQVLRQRRQDLLRHGRLPADAVLEIG